MSQRRFYRNLEKFGWQNTRKNKRKNPREHFILYEDFEGEFKSETFVNEAHETMLERLKTYDASEDEFRIWKN